MHQEVSLESWMLKLIFFVSSINTVLHLIAGGKEVSPAWM